MTHTACAQARACARALFLRFARGVLSIVIPPTLFLASDVTESNDATRSQQCVETARSRASSLCRDGKGVAAAYCRRRRRIALVPQRQVATRRPCGVST